MTNHTDIATLTTANKVMATAMNVGPRIQLLSRMVAMMCGWASINMQIIIKPCVGHKVIECT